MIWDGLRVADDIEFDCRLDAPGLYVQPAVYALLELIRVCPRQGSDCIISQRWVAVTEFSGTHSDHVRTAEDTVVYRYR